MNKGLTLVEMVVVTAIVAVLAGVALPVLARAKAQAKDSDRAHRLRQIGLAAGLYDADFGPALPVGEPGRLVVAGYLPAVELVEPTDPAPRGFGNSYRSHGPQKAFPFKVSAAGYLDGFEPDVAQTLPTTPGSFRFVLCPTVVQYGDPVPNWTPDGRYQGVGFDGSVHPAVVQNQNGHFRFVSLFLP